MYGFRVESGYLIWCRESKRDNLLCLVVRRRLDSLHFITYIPLVSNIVIRRQFRPACLPYIGQLIVVGAANLVMGDCMIWAIVYLSGNAVAPRLLSGVSIGFDDKLKWTNLEAAPCCCLLLPTQ